MNVCSLLCNPIQGEIRATAFNDTAERFYPQFEVDKVYYISKCQVKNANKQYSSLKNDYEMTFRDDAEVEEVCTYCTYMCCRKLHELKNLMSTGYAFSQEAITLGSKSRMYVHMYQSISVVW